MTSSRTLALDVMGGDHGPLVTIAGAALSAIRHPSISFILCGNEAVIAPELARHPSLSGRVKIQHTEQTVAMDDKPSQALRRGKGSSMWIALEAVQNCVLFADSSNELSAEFYSKLGFDVCGTWVKVSTTGK